MSNNENQPVSVSYETTQILHITQFLLSASGEEVIVDCSSGPIPDRDQPNGLKVPVHARIALPWSAAQRLAQSLQQAIANQNRQQHAQPTAQPQPQSPVAAPAQTNPHATLPRMTN